MELYQDIKGEKLQKMFEFLNGVSDRISIERYCTERIPEEEFERMQMEYKEHILEADRKRREEYATDKNNIRRILEIRLGINSDKKAKKYFDELLEQELDVLNAVENDGEERVVNPIEQDVIAKKYTRITPTTEGPIMQQYHIKIGELLKSMEENMTSIFSFPYSINNEEYENLTFYNGDKVIFSICSHENYACVMLDDSQKKEFQKMGIKLEDEELEH